MQSMLFCVCTNRVDGGGPNLQQSRGCFGCCSKPPHVISVDKPSNGLIIQGQSVKKKRFSAEEFWSSTSADMDNSTVPSHRSISSISTSNQTFDTQSNADGTSTTSEFVNHGLLWNQARQQWVGVKGSEKSEQIQEPKLSWDATYDSLLGTNKPFPQPIPLAEMVDFLVDIWEEEGLYG